MDKLPLPSSAELEGAVLSALSAHNGNATNAEIYSAVVKDLKLSPEQTKIMRSGNRTEIEYRLAWARTRMRKKGLINRHSPSVWSLAK